jgi:hypothetical protein
MQVPKSSSSARRTWAPRRLHSAHFRANGRFYDLDAYRGRIKNGLFTPKVKPTPPRAFQSSPFWRPPLPPCTSLCGLTCGSRARCCRAQRSNLTAGFARFNLRSRLPSPPPNTQHAHQQQGPIRCHKVAPPPLPSAVLKNSDILEN